MTCEKCMLWVKRELPQTKKRKKGFYPTGRCLNPRFNMNGRPMFTGKDTHCDDGNGYGD